MTQSEDPSAGPAAPRPIDSGLKGACPRCGAKTLFASVAKYADKCSTCGLDYDQFNVGDGPVVFLTLGIGTLVTVLAIIVELSFAPPFWVHAVLWIPLTAILVVGTLHFAKGLLLALEYRNKAAEGRIARDE
ncbi:DUF983 domain-containing protein [Stakelama tenebrarum]|uniref:DUF983 domain-containing protein n=1 Tax=Stakelama tenebrarum TaxID=2711215 RepID=A0A6G6Y1A7_9SPHN|nr:DUF983 domain-containing protein [Sphingosinithalassobacter tenebrarum]QIG78356.1 DUF983 domain-containing protein [Sphingosinithalassobacter tenebrarum]